MKTIKVAFGIHNHQPVGNFDFVFEYAYEKSYLPFIELLQRHPKIRMAQHYTGILLEWLLKNRPGFVEQLRKLVESGQIEMMTGGYYEPVMSIISHADRVGQIRKLNEFVKEHTGYDAKGMWLAERIWEPTLPTPCVEAGVRYVVLDDSHFRNAGVRQEELTSYYVTEDCGAMVYLFPIAERLRYTIPFEQPEVTIDYLREQATEAGDKLIVFADDGEKFGVWPGTYAHCYEKGWLERFFTALEENLDWIQIVHLSEAVEQLNPAGRIYLPTAAYREMMEWAMPSGSIHEYEAFEKTLREHEMFERYKIFVRGGFWRNFLAKYPESNSMHKKMLHIHSRLDRLAAEHGDDAIWLEARDHIWAGQCNCPYWHGVFGGLYLNHLRYATYHEFIQAEVKLDVLEYGKSVKATWCKIEEKDLSRDGFDEILVSTPVQNIYFSPNNGGTIFELDFKPKAINLLDTMTRREESYHRRLREGTPAVSGEVEEDSDSDSIPSIHDLVMVKEPGLEKALHYDWYRRVSLVDHFLDFETKLPEMAESRFRELGDFIAAAYESRAEESDNGALIELKRRGTVRQDSDSSVEVTKTIRVDDTEAQQVIHYRIHNQSDTKLECRFGPEFNFALLAGDAPDRNFIFPCHEVDDTRLRSSGEVGECDELHLQDDWQGLRISLSFSQKGDVWRFPIETISQSEAGFERVYQNSVVLPLWPLSLEADAIWDVEIGLTVSLL